MKASSHLALWGALASLVPGCTGTETDLELPPAIATSLATVDTAGRLGGATVDVAISIVNGADGVLEDLAATVSYTGPAAAPAASWLNVSLDKTTATRTEPATLRLRADPSNLQLGEVQATVTLTASGASNSPFSIPVRLR